MITRNELVALINTSWDAVNASKAGPIVKEDGTGERVLINPGYNVFLSVISKLVPCEMAANMDFTEHKADGSESSSSMEMNR